MQSKARKARADAEAQALAVRQRRNAVCFANMEASRSARLAALEAESRLNPYSDAERRLIAFVRVSQGDTHAKRERRPYMGPARSFVEPVHRPFSPGALRAAEKALTWLRAQPTLVRPSRGDRSPLAVWTRGYIAWVKRETRRIERLLQRHDARDILVAGVQD